METDEKRKEKQILRKKFLKIRDSILYDERIKKDKIIIEKIMNFEEFIKANNIMIYYPFRSEVNLLSLIELCKEKNFYFPVVDFEKKELKVAKYNGKFKQNKFGILEPENSEIIDKNELDLVLVPGVVFDLRGYRIGYGGGYYDRFLSNINSYNCGVCYDEQIVGIIPASSEDVALNYIISDRRIIRLL